MNLVVGSGPAGIACAQALLAGGSEVCLVDAGLTLEPERAAITRRLAGEAPAAWDAASVARLREGMDQAETTVILKRSFGSDFPYRGADEEFGLTYEGVALRPSLARGGLSNVWGAAMLPYRAGDLAGWPVSVEELAPHYRAVLGFTGLAGQQDDLTSLFPLYHPNPTTLPFSRQAGRLWTRLEKHRGRLRRAGLHFGAARLAVQAAPASGGRGCVRCGMCMYGCPYGFIYNSADTLADLMKNPRFRYQPGIVVRRVSESATEAVIEGRYIGSGESWSARGERIFLAAGVIPTTRLLLSARGIYDRPVWIRDSQYFLFPLLAPTGVPDVQQEALHALSQIFLEIIDPKISPHTVHLQLYSYSDLIAGGIRTALGPLGHPWLVRQLAERTIIVQGYLHSDHSSRIRMVLEKGEAIDRTRLTAELNPATPRIVARVLRKLLGSAWRLGMAPGFSQLQLTPPGRGYHCGGSLPMRAQPGELETDTLGRPPGWRRVHAVDATVLPSIPATTITLSAMANAHRIASAALAESL